MAQVEVTVEQITESEISVKTPAGMTVSFEVDTKQYDVKKGDTMILELPDDLIDVYQLKPN